MKPILWHNPRCSKSRAALKLLEERGITPEIRLYLKDPPSKSEIRTLQKLLGLQLFEMMRPKEKIFRELGLSKDSPAEELLTAITEHPILLERPILVNGERAVIGRPPERVLEIL